MPTKIWNKNYFLLWQGQLVSMVGGQIFSVAILLWAKHYTESATMLGLLMMTYNIPGLIFGPIGGAIVDSYSRKMIIIMADLINGFMMLILAVLFFFITMQQDYILAWLFVTSAVTGLTRSIMGPAMLSAIPDLVPRDKLETANAIGMGTLQISQLCTQAVGGVLYRVWGMPLLSLINSISFLLSAISETFMDIPEHSKPDQTTTNSYTSIFKKHLHDTVSGFKYLISKKGMKELVLMAAIVNFFAVPAVMLLPFYVEDYLGATTDWYGYLVSAAGAGSLIGYTVSGKIRLRGDLRFFAICIVWQCVSLATLSLGMVDDRYSALGLLTLIGALNGFIGINVLSIIQTHIAPSMRGRAFGILGTVSGCLSPIALGLTGIIFDLTGKNIPAVYITIGAILTIPGIVIAFNSNCRSFITDERAAETI